MHSHLHPLQEIIQAHPGAFKCKINIPKKDKREDTEKRGMDEEVVYRAIDHLGNF